MIPTVAGSSNFEHAVQFLFELRRQSKAGPEFHMLNPNRNPRRILSYGNHSKALVEENPKVKGTGWVNVVEGNNKSRCTPSIAQSTYCDWRETGLVHRGRYQIPQFRRTLAGRNHHGEPLPLHLKHPSRLTK
jgi:hypothetical protein